MGGEARGSEYRHQQNTIVCLQDASEPDALYRVN